LKWHRARAKAASLLPVPCRLRILERESILQAHLHLEHLLSLNSFLFKRVCLSILIYIYILASLVYEANYKLSLGGAVHSATSEVLIQKLNDTSANGPMGVEICVRFGCLQSRLRNQTYNGTRAFASGNSSGRNVQTSAREVIGQLIASMGERLSEYGPYLPLHGSFHLQVWIQAKAT
jgi:hypothetical protein